MDLKKNILRLSQISRVLTKKCNLASLTGHDNYKGKPAVRDLLSCQSFMWLFAANYAYFIPSQSKCFCNTQNGANFEDYTKEMLFVT